MRPKPIVLVSSYPPRLCGIATFCEELSPWVVHLEHEYGLYEYRDSRGIGDGNGRLDWTFQGRGWATPRNTMVVPHGARPDKRWGGAQIPELRKEFGLDQAGLAEHLVGMIGWIQANKRWDILLSMWEDIHREIMQRSGLEWDLLAAGSMRDPDHTSQYTHWKAEKVIKPALDEGLRLEFGGNLKRYPREEI